MEGVEKVNSRVDKRSKENEELKGRVLELQTRNVLLEAKVRSDSALVIGSSSGSLFTSGKSQKPYGPYEVVENLMICQSSLISPS